MHPDDDEKQPPAPERFNANQQRAIRRLRGLHNTLRGYSESAHEIVKIMTEDGELAGWASVAQAQDKIESTRKLLRTALGELGTSIAQEGLE